LKSIATAGGRQPAALVAIGTAGALLLLGAGSAVAATGPATSSAPPPGQVAVPQGIGAAALSRAQVVGQAAASKKEQVSFVLNARNLGSLRAKVVSGGTGSYLTTSQFAKTYGQTSASIDALVGYLRQHGITCHVLADHLDVSTTGTVASYNRALRVRQHEYKLGAVPARHGHLARPAATFAGTAQPATLPTRVGKIVLSVLGLTAYPAAVSNAVHTPALPRGARPAATQKGTLTPADFASRYHLSPLQQAGHLGQGQTIGIVTLASMRASDATHFWSTTLRIQTKANRISLDNVDGGAGKVSQAAGSGETTLDVEQSGALAPDANVDVYQAPNTDGGFLDAFATAASQDRAGAVSSSWGDSETFIDFNAAARKESAHYAQAFNEIFLELAAQGQSSFIAAGDDGAYDAFGDQGSTNLSVDEPGSSPYTTDAGGTTLPGTIPVASGVSATVGTERAWGWDWLWPDWRKLGASSEKSFAEQYIAGGGGGFSVDEATPFYQAHWLNVHHFSAVKYLTPTDFVSKDSVRLPTKWNLTAAPAVTTGTGTGRAVPDLSADADPYTGYEEYFTGFSGSPLETGWGGTSFVAPQLAGTTAVIDSAVGHRVGFWNPSIYRFAAGGGSPFTPLDQSGKSNDNLYYTGTKGNLFNAGTGLGIPNFAELAADFG
jgi:subtilase family serine protease